MNRHLSMAIVGALLATGVLAATEPVWARAGGGSGSSGSRGSRSYSTPARPAPTPASPTTAQSPSRTLAQPASAPRSSFFGGGLMGGIAGFALGGLLGSMLFGGMHGGGFGGGFGLLELVLLGGVAFLVIRMMRRRAEPAPAYATGYASESGGQSLPSGAAATLEMPLAERSDLERGFGHIRQMDPAFDPQTFAVQTREAFHAIQQALVLRDLTPVADRLTSRMYIELQGQVDRLKSARQTNRVEQIEIRRGEVSEAWQEAGADWVTVYLAGSLLDYTLDDASGGMVDGSRTTPQEFEEFWSFTRTVGPNRWKLSAIQTA
ncbi:MAG: Tim44 domain-containing protein [Candidatus Rokuibacteriota bacterium]